MKMSTEIVRVLKAHGRDKEFHEKLLSGAPFYAKFEKPNFMPLVIEVVGKQRVSVAHYYEQNGDLMADPEVVFGIVGDDWWPIELKQQPFNIHRTKFFTDSYGKTMVDVTFHREVSALVNVWARNIRYQDWEHAKEEKEYTDEL